MNRARYYALRGGAIAMIVTLIGLYLAGVSYAQHQHTMPRPAPQQARPVQPPKADPSLQAIHSKQLPAIQEAVARAIQHLEAGHQQEALNEMKQVKAALEGLRQALGKQVGPLFLNDRCPIMGTKIDPDKVTPELTRMYGQGKVAFCCGGCPAQWDGLTEAQKTAKLKVVAAPGPKDRL